MYYCHLIWSAKIHFIPQCCACFDGIINNFLEEYFEKQKFVFLQPLRTLSVSKGGDLAHLVERQVRNLKVAGSSPVISTKHQDNLLKFSGFFFFKKFYPLFYPLKTPNYLILCGDGLLHKHCFDSV